MLASVQQQLRDAQTTMVQSQEHQASLEQTLAQTRQDLAQANAAAEGAQGEIVRQAQIHEVRQSRMSRDLMEAQAQGEATQLILASVREELARTRHTLEQEQGRNAAQGDVLANTQAVLSETSASLAEVRVALAEQSEAHASTQADKQQWVERYWDMERQNNETRVALRRSEQAHAETQQALDQTTRQARLDGIRQSQLHRDLTEAQAQVETTQAALSETSASLAEVRTAMAEQSEAHAGAQAAVQADRQQWAERYWDMEQQRNETRQALRRAEQSYAEAQQVLDRRNARRAEVAARTEAVADLVRQHFADEIQQNQLSVRAGKWRVKLASADAFDFVRAVELGSRSVQTLDRLAEMLQEIPSHQVRFAVHTDNIPLRRGARWPTNWELSTARAAKLARYLIDQGVAPERLSIGGYGDSRPVADNDTPEGRQQNRRVEVIIKPPRQR